MDHDSEDGATPTLSKKAKIVEAPAVMSNEIPLNNLIDVSSGCCCLESNDAYTSPGLPGSFSDRQAFWEALKVHVERPHILNRRLCGAVDICTALPPLLPARPYMISLITSAGAAVEGETIAVCGLFKSTYLAGVPQLTAEGGPTGDGRAWLQGTVLPRLHKWAKPRVSQETAIRSLQLINLQSYGLLYHNLKTKYANHLIQSWSERTDPKKFVHEDIGIATYLLLLWSQHSRPQRFIDLGCGNGLLVYILTKEGHCGTGYDIKSRNIWLERFSDIDLQELEVTPNTTSFSADVDWLIGNHSDELTPWLPVMAARTSHFCSFFLLPCCPHDFTTKFLRRNTKKSQYGDYLDYVEVIGRVCGFNVERDRLKIPSTKRECFVGRSKLHTEQERPSVLTSIQEFIDSRVAANVSNLGRGTDLKRSGDFVARPKEQRVRNCTQLARGVKEDLVQCVVRLLLGDGDKKEEWWAGGSIELRDAAASLTAEQLRQMKQECGGLKTLLKNHRHIFLLQGSQVQLRGELRSSRNASVLVGSQQTIPKAAPTLLMNACIAIDLLKFERVLSNK
ncbi:hypothetical protein HAZT_HAZT000452, partial [Hyalella azteca]